LKGDIVVPLVTPLCNVSELGQAFGLLMPRADAERWARTWFERFAADEDVDGDGRYLYSEWWKSDADGSDEPQAMISGCAGPDAAARALVEHFRQQSTEELGESLMSFSGLHLKLLSLVSPELFDRVRAIERRAPEEAVMAREWMRQVVHQLQAER